jgi:hypothetical protein
MVGKIGDWTVLKRAGSDIHNHPNWLCRCICGTEKLVSASSLQQGRSKSCGCTKVGPRRKRPFESLYNRLFSTAKNRGIEMSLTFEQFLELTNKTKCYYCNSTLVWHVFDGTHHTYLSRRYNLDRKDNSLGYSVDNVVACCKECNFGKGARYTFEEWVVMTEALARLRKANKNVQNRAFSARA